MSRQADSQERDWRELRFEIRLLCREAAKALEDGRGLRHLRPRPLPDDMESSRRDLFRVLGSHEWSANGFLDDKTIYKSIKLYDLLYGICKRGHELPAAWGVVLELCESGTAKTFVQPRQTPGVTNLDAGEGSVFLSLSPEAINRFLDSRIPEESPKWDRDSRTLTFKNIICKTFTKYATKQFAILDAFEQAGWPKSVRVPEVMSRQTSESLNSTMEPGSPIRFGFSEKAQSVSWRLEG